MWTVVVGNIGEVYEGESESEAFAFFEDYSKQSKSAVGRASGEPVTLFKDGEIVDETPAVEWTVEVGNIIVGYFDNEEEAEGCYNEYCGLEPQETVRLLRDNKMEDQRDPFFPEEDEESEDEDYE
jgi:hypothetical protein